MSLTHTDDRLEVVHENPVEISEDHGPAAEQGPVVSSASPASEGDGAADALSTARPTFTITDAAAACSVSRKTITRKLSDLSDHGAAKDDDGVWRIPVEALLAVGLHPGRSVPEVTSAPAARPVPPAAPVPPMAQETVTIPRDRWDDLRIRLARAEAEANERAAALADARLALRALTAGPSGSVGAPSQASRAPVPMAPAPDQQAPATGAARTDEAPTSAAVAMPAGVDALAARPGGSGAPEPMAGAVPRADATPTPGPVPAGGEDLVAARNLAARTGGYVPATAAPAKKRRWWQSH
jgi:hypothetical protein